MSRFKLDYDEGTWLLTIDSGDTEVTYRLDDHDAFDLNKTLEPVRFRRREYEHYKATYRGAVQAGFFYDPDNWSRKA